MDTKRRAILRDILETAVREAKEYTNSISRPDFDPELVKEKEKEIVRLGHAFDALERDEYGYCFEPKCRKEIPIHSLRAFPLTARCRECVVATLLSL